MCTPNQTERNLRLLEDLQRFPNIFSQLQPDGEHRLTAKVSVSGYSGLVFLVMDILKVSLLALEADPPYPTEDIRDPHANISSLIDLAVQLMPLEELELLDILHAHHLEQSRANQ